ncbi:hypothetical protein TKK_0008149 [Trichogramma kaykai]
MAIQNSTPTSAIKILYWNARSITHKFLETKKISADYDIIICVESWLTSDKELIIPGFITHRKDWKHTRGGGIAIWIKKNLALKEFHCSSPYQSVELTGLLFNNITPELNSSHCLLLGDFNALNSL